MQQNNKIDQEEKIFMDSISMDTSALLVHAKSAMENAYAPYSHFKVGAAVLTENGAIYSGCNIENASYGATNCAERTAIFKAVSEGHTRIKAVYIVSSSGDFTPPCGICRQVMSEFMKEDGLVIMGNSHGEERCFSIKELLPVQFDLL